MGAPHQLRLVIAPDAGEDVSAGSDLTLRVGKQDGRTVLSVAGEIDITNSDWLTDRLAAEIDSVSPKYGVIVDLASVGFCDASGIRSLLVTCNHCRERHTSLLVTGVRGPVRRVLAITGADQALPLAPEPEREPRPGFALHAVEGDLSERSQPPVLATHHPPGPEPARP